MGESSREQQLLGRANYAMHANGGQFPTLSPPAPPYALQRLRESRIVRRMTAKELFQWRTSRKLTREQLAELLSPSKKETLSFRTIERWEQNRNAKIPVFLRLALKEVERNISHKSENND